jgi:hypothetical protein
LWIGDFLKDAVYLRVIELKSRRANVSRKDTPMQRVHYYEPKREQELSLDLDEIARQGAKQMLAEALEAEVQNCLETARGERDEHGSTHWPSERATTTAARCSVGLGPGC